MMERYTVTLTNLTRDDGADRIEAYLQAAGVQTAGVQTRIDERSATVSVLADRDPGDLLRAYTPTPTDDEQERAAALADAQAAIDAIAQKDRAQRTDSERILFGLALASDAVTRPDAETRRGMP